MMHPARQAYVEEEPDVSLPSLWILSTGVKCSYGNSEAGCFSSGAMDLGEKKSAG